jgi:hypothetical protein
MAMMVVVVVAATVKAAVVVMVAASHVVIVGWILDIFYYFEFSASASPAYRVSAAGVIGGRVLI